MRLHNLIKGLDDLRKFYKFKESGIPYINEQQRSFTQFDFGSLKELSLEEREGLLKYGLDLLHSKNLSLPYDGVIFNAFIGGIHATFIAWNEKDRIFIDAYCSDRDMVIISTTSAIDLVRSSDGSGATQIIYRMPCFQAYYPERVITVDDEIQLNNIIMSGTRGMSPKDHISLMTSHLIVCLAFLNAEGVTTIVESAPKKLNEKRAKQGKPPITDVHQVVIMVNGKRYLPSGRHDGSHRKMHWRRGHIRHLGNGKITNVRPCLVNFIPGNEAPTKPEYLLKM